MSTHIFLDGLESERLRRLLEACPFCDARAGEPCKQTVGVHKGYYVCTDEDCEQLYENANDALNCTMHNAPRAHIGVAEGE